MRGSRGHDETREQYPYALVDECTWHFRYRRVISPAHQGMASLATGIKKSRRMTRRGSKKSARGLAWQKLRIDFSSTLSNSKVCCVRVYIDTHAMSATST